MKLSCPFGRVQNYVIVCEHTTYFAIIVVLLSDSLIYVKTER